MASSRHRQRGSPDRAVPDASILKPAIEVNVPTGVASAKKAADQGPTYVPPMTQQHSKNLELLLLLTWRDIKVRYRQSYLGLLWVLFQPLSQMLIFTVVFSRHFSANVGVPYPLFLLAGLVPWTAISTTINQGSISLLNNGSLLRKIYFPRELLPLSNVLSGCFDLAAGASILVIGSLFYTARLPGSHLLYLLPALALHVLFVSGVCMLLSTLTVFVRDVRHIIATCLTLLLFVTPVLYPASEAPARLREFLTFNPLATMIQTYRTAFLGSPPPNLPDYLLALGVSLGILLAGYYFLKSSESAASELV